MPPPKGHAPYRNAAGELPGGSPPIWTDERINQEADALFEWLKEKNNFLFSEFCYERDLQEDYPSKWAKKNDRFNQAYRKARLKQQIVLSKNALIKRFDSGFSKWFLQCNYKWKEDTDTSGLDEETSTPGSRALADIKETCIEHTNAIEQAGDKPKPV